VERPVDVLVVGGGVIGLAIAREAARAGMTVRLLDRGAPGGEASGASAGILSAQLEAHHPGPILPLAFVSRALYPSLVAALLEETGVDVDLRLDGALIVARGAAAAFELERTFAFQRGQGLPVERLDAAALRRVEPAITEAAVLGLRLPDEASLDPVALVRALVLAAGRAGADIRTPAEVAALSVSGGRVDGVMTADGTAHPAGQVVVAAGAWAGTLTGPGIARVPSEPVRGQIVAFEAPGLIRHVLSGGTCYLVPRSDGRVLAGSTMEHAGFDRRVTAEGLAHLAAAALALVPGLAPTSFHRAWAGLRPGAPDGLPVIGPAATGGLLYAYGHLRNGIVLTPLTARAIVGMLRGGGAPVEGIDLAPFSPLRFADARAGS
jgi:glycine oxidase